MYTITVYKDATLSSKKTYQALRVKRVSKGFQLFLAGRPRPLLIPTDQMIMLQSDLTSALADN